MSVWLGLILLAVGLVFSCSSPRPQLAMAVGPSEATAALYAAAAAGDGGTVLAGASEATAAGAPGAPVAPAGTADAEALATLTAAPTATLAPTPTLTATATAAPSSTASPTASATAKPTPTSTSTPTPVPTPTPVLGRPVRLVAPSIGLDTTVVEVGWHVETIEGTKLAVWDVADYAAGWHKTSARPGGGGNIVISGHHNILGEVFRYVIDLQVGADIVLYAEDTAEPYVYKVEENLLLPEKGQPLEVRRQNAAYIDPTTDERVTLVTCWPYNNNTHRVVVIAKPAG